MSAKHTPGPWQFIDATQSAPYKFDPACVIKAGEVQVASFRWNDRIPWFPAKNESQANARLIAAAPDLLEALEMITATYTAMRETLSKKYPLDGWSSKTMTIDAARAAIAKARSQA